MSDLLTAADASPRATVPGRGRGRGLQGRRWPGSYLDLFSVRTWRITGHLVLDVVVGSISFSLIVSLLSTSIGLAITFPLAIPFAWLTVWLARATADLERRRIRALLDVDIVGPRRPAPTGRWTRTFWAYCTDGGTWRAIAHSIVLLPLGVLTFAAAVVAWCLPLTLLLLPATIWALPHDQVRLGALHLGTGTSIGLGVGLGLALVGFVPLVIRGLGELDVLVARALLGASRTADLDARVATLETRRAAVVDEAEAERRRIERDLHDGAQQRLVALALDLGMAQQKFDSAPEEARALIDDAHREAKQALVEMRDLVRGIHPAVLADRGLGAALSSVVARCSVPVDLAVQIEPRPDERAEAIAYFVVCESLVNIDRHSGATRARVSLVRRGQRLSIEVADDGHGGADPTGGTGLAGLRARVEGVDGWFHVSSPPGGPTMIVAEVPCAS